MNQIFREMPALALAHLDQFLQRVFERGLHGRPDLFGAQFDFRKTHHSRRLQNHADRDFTGSAKFPLQAAHRFVVGTSQGGVERRFARAIRAGVVNDHHICSAARNFFVDRLPNARLELGQFARHIHHNVTLFAIDRVEFDADFCPAVVDLATSVTSHAAHCLPLKSKMDSCLLHILITGTGAVHDH